MIAAPLEAGFCFAFSGAFAIFNIEISEDTMRTLKFVRKVCKGAWEELKGTRGIYPTRLIRWFAFSLLLVVGGLIALAISYFLDTRIVVLISGLSIGAGLILAGRIIKRAEHVKKDGCS